MPAELRITMKQTESNVLVFVVCGILCGTLLLAAAPASFAQGAAPTLTAPTASAAPALGPRAEAMRLIEDAETKLIRLAEIIPADKYTWRPGTGVRSVSEVFLHVAGGNFNIPRRLGTDPPADFKPQGFDTSTSEKAKVVETLKQSFAHVRQAAMKLSDADMEKTAPWFGGRQATYREILFFLATHEHEHLGQSIAYARMNNITPPWTEEQQQRMRQQQQQQPQQPPPKPKP